MPAYTRRPRPRSPVRRRKLPSSRWKGLTLQALAAGVAFTVVFCVTLLPEPWSASLVGPVRSILTWEYDFLGAFRNLSQVNLPVDLSLDRLRRFWGIYPLPDAGSMTWPAGGPVVATFGWQSPSPGGQALSDGIDISAAAGSPVRAALAGTVTAVRSSPVYGMVIEIDHGNGLTTLYGRCDEARVAPRQRVDKGQIIASVARSPTGRHQLYFEVRLSGQAVDPLRWLPAETSP
ncbi:MAG: M23 family metallopeptidase [Bacillota bacterium]